ncbi:hepatic lectin-like [Anolis sagrei]|uniref:hepatic lectin-like n=1 Tax=Anolis sagrei TaxID=38937 RepID=UPI003520FD0B
MSNELFPCGSRNREWEYFHGGCYYFSVIDATWHTAQDHCTEKNASLVVIHDMAKQNFIQSQSRGRRFWLGLTDGKTEGQWTWVDGTNYRTGFKNWKQGEPNDYQNQEDCAEMGVLGEWNDVACNNKGLYICEKPLLS